jgi:hypothetical protein
MEAVWDFYGPWIRLMLQVGVPLFLLATPAMLLFERGSLPRWVVGRVVLFGWALVLGAAALYLILRIVQNAFANLPGA